MHNQPETELDLLKKQLEWVKQQDQLLEEIEDRLYEMRSVAQIVSMQGFTVDEAEKQNQILKEHQEAIRELEGSLSLVLFGELLQ